MTEGLHEDEEIDGEQLAEKMAQQRATMEGTLKVLLLRGSLGVILCLLHDPAGLQGALPRTDVEAFVGEPCVLLGLAHDHHDLAGLKMQI